MAEGTMETRTVASLLCTAAGFSISVSDLTRTILDTEDPFWAQYMERGGKINADLFVPESELAAFAADMASNMEPDPKTNALIYSPVNFSVIETVNMPCPENAVGAKIEGVGLVRVFDGNMMPLMADAKPVYEADRERMNEELEKLVAKDPTVSREVLMEKFATEHKIDLGSMTTTNAEYARIGNLYTVPYCRIVVPEGELMQNKDGIRVDDNGNPCYGDSYLQSAKRLAEKHHGGFDLKVPNWEEETDITKLLTEKLNDSRWVGQNTRLITDLSFEESRLLADIASKNDLGFLVHKNIKGEDFAFEVLEEVTHTDRFARTMAEYEILTSHPQIQEHLTAERRDATVVSDILNNAESLDDTSLILMSRTPSDKYIRITDVARDDSDLHLIVTMHGFNDRDPSATRIIDLQNDKDGYRNFIKATMDLKEFSVIRGDKTCDRFETLLQKQGLDGIKQGYKLFYDKEKDLNNFRTAVKTAVEENISRKDITFGEHQDMQVRIPNSDKLIQTIATTTDNPLTERDKLEALQTAISREKSFMHITPASAHISTPSHMFKDISEMVLDDRGIETTLSRRSMTPQEIANYDELNNRRYKEMENDYRDQFDAASAFFSNGNNYFDASESWERSNEEWSAMKDNYEDPAFSMYQSEESYDPFKDFSRSESDHIEQDNEEYYYEEDSEYDIEPDFGSWSSDAD